jgi:hypothetical protein
MSNPIQTERMEPRWPVAIALLVLLALVAVVPDHYRLLPSWMPFAVAAMACLPMAGVARSARRSHWLRIEGVVLKLFAVFIILSAAVVLAVLIRDIILGSPQASGLELLTSSVVVWACNVLGFSLLYWQVDGDGPEGRMQTGTCRTDWLFAQATALERVPPDWQSTFADYLFLAFSTATAFSTTDTLPLTVRAKLLMMLEALISMVTLVVVASRAINVLGS